MATHVPLSLKQRDVTMIILFYFKTTYKIVIPNLGRINTPVSMDCADLFANYSSTRERVQLGTALLVVILAAS